MPKIMIMAGGTGGHIFPGLAVAEVLLQNDWTIEWMGTADRMEADIVPARNIKLNTIEIKGARGKGLLAKFVGVKQLIVAVIQAVKLLKLSKPDVVLGMGGYASGPGGLASKLLGLPLIIHEQNAIFGLTNRFLAKIAMRVFTGFDCNGNAANARAPAATHWVGNPVREEFFQIKSREEIENQAVNILVTGGSLGAQALNEKLPSIISKLSNHHSINVVHQCGKGKLDTVSEYKNTVSADIVEFIDNVASKYEWADIIICRAGALTVAEVAAAARPAIFVPLPIAVDDHQTANAKALLDNNAAYIVQQNDIELSMKERLLTLLEPDTRKEIGLRARAYAKQNAANNIADFCMEVVTKGRAA